jgi:hypothetical protein
MLRKTSNRNFFRKSLKPILLALWGFFAVPFSGVVSSWLYDFLKSLPKSFLLQVFINISNTQLPLSQILLVLAVFVIPLLFIFRMQREKYKERLKALLKRVKQNRLILLKKVEKDCIEFKQSQLILVKKIEQDFTEFIFDVFESDLDPDLIKITESALNSKNSYPLVERILHGLEKYFKDMHLTSITIFRPYQAGEYLRIKHSTVHYSEELKDDLMFYMGDSPDNHNHRIGIAGFTYREFTSRREKIQKFFLNQEDEAFLIKIDDNGQVIEKAFPHYRPLIDTERIIAIHSTAAVALFRQGNNQTKILGVLCVDSYNGEIFKSKSHDDKLLKSAQCIAIAIEIEDLLNEFHQS